MIAIKIPHELVDLNKFVNAQRANRFGGNKIKRQNTELCKTYFKKAINEGLKLNSDSLPINITFEWHVKNKRKDKDNIAFAKKFVLDGMVESGLIPNDGWKEVGSLTDTFQVNKEMQGVIVYIKPIKEESCWE